MRNLMIDVIKNTSSLYHDEPLDTTNWNDFSNKDLIKLYRQVITIHLCSIVQCCEEDIGIELGTSQQITNLILDGLADDDSEIFDIR